MAETLTTALDLFPQLTADPRPLPEKTTPLVSNPFVHQLVNILSQSVAQSPLAPGDALLQPGKGQTAPEIPLLPGGKTLPLEGKPLPQAVDSALALMHGQRDAAAVAGESSGPVSALQLFARALTEGSPKPSGRTAGEVLTPEMESRLAPAVEVQPQTTPLAPPVTVPESVLTDPARGGVAPTATPVIDAQKLLDKRLSGINLPASGHIELPGQATTRQGFVDLPTLPEAAHRAMPQAQGQPFVAAATDGAEPLNFRVERGTGYQGPSGNSLDAMVTEARGATQSTSLNPLTQNAVAASAAMPREPLLHVPQHILNDSQWSQVMGNRLNWMVQQGVQTAAIQLVPEDLGQIQVRVSMIGEQANIEFHARHRHTSELIETMLPRLMSALDAQGVRVEEVKVSQGPLPDQQQAMAQHTGHHGANNPDGHDQSLVHPNDSPGGPLETGEHQLLTGSIGLSLVDAYA